MRVLGSKINFEIQKDNPLDAYEITVDAIIQ